MKLSTFYEECQPLPEKERRWFDFFYQTVIDVFGEENQDFQNMHNVYSLFYSKRSSFLSKAQYFRRRKFVFKLYDWLEEKRAVDKGFVEKVHSLKLQDVISDVELYRHYFKDLDAALDFVRGIGQLKGLGDYDDLLNIKAIVILLWYQVDVSDLLELHKSDLCTDRNAVMVNGREVQIPVEYFNVLVRFASLDVHKGFPSQKLQNYKDSRYFMRSAYQESLNSNNVVKALLRFNEIAANYGKELSIVALKRNGIFSQVYVKERVNSEIAKSVNTLMQEETGCDTAFAVGYKNFYERWKQIIIGGDET